MKVKLSTTLFIGPKKTHAFGSTVDLDEKEAQRLIALGQAEEVKEPVPQGADAARLKAEAEAREKAEAETKAKAEAEAKAKAEAEEKARLEAEAKAREQGGGQGQLPGTSQQ